MSQLSLLLKEGVSPVQKKDDLNCLLRKGISLVRKGELFQGRRLLRNFVKENPKNVTGWLWLSVAGESGYERRKSLDKVLKLDPNNRHAEKILKKLVQEPHVDPIKQNKVYARSQRFRAIPTKRPIISRRLVYYGTVALQVVSDILWVGLFLIYIAVVLLFTL